MIRIIFGVMIGMFLYRVFLDSLADYIVYSISKKLRRLHDKLKRKMESNKGEFKEVKKKPSLYDKTDIGFKM